MLTLPTIAAVRPWWLKAGVQGTLSLFPQPQRWNRLFQRYVTRSITLQERTFQRKWRQALRHVANWRSERTALPASALELGTGWHPVVPCGLALLGVPRIHTLDVTSLLCTRTLAETIARYDALLHALPADAPIDSERAA